VTDAINRALCCGPVCGRGTDATGPCVAATYGHAIRQRAEAAGFAVVPAEATDAMVLAAMGRRDQLSEPTLYHGIYRAMIAPQEAVYLTTREQRVMDRALRRASKIEEPGHE